MTEIAKSEIFFFVTTIIVVVLGILSTVILVYGIYIFKNIKEISDRIKKESELISDDIRELRANLRAELRTEGRHWKAVGKFVRSILSRRSGRNKKEN